jgi:HupE / UreJ protein
VASARSRRGGVALSAAATALALTTAAAAHQVGLSRGDYAFAGSEVTAEIIFARGELASLIPELDANGDGRLTPDEVEAGGARLEAAIVARTTVTANGARCPGKLVAARLAEEDGLTVRGVFRCPSAAPTARVDLGFLEDLAHGHRHVARARGPSGEIEDVLFRGKSALDVPAGAPLASPSAASPSPSATVADGAPSFLALGLTRFLREYLHAAFLVGALAAVASRRARFEIAAAFAVGSTAGLALAALGVWSPDARALGPAIAVSVVYAGLSGAFADQGRPARATTLAFGAVHGFGLATALRTLGTGASSALVPYALGAVFAVIAVAAAVIAVATWADRSATHKGLAPRIACAAVALVGLAATARTLAG